MPTSSAPPHSTPSWAVPAQGRAGCTPCRAGQGRQAAGHGKARQATCRAGNASCGSRQGKARQATYGTGKASCGSRQGKAGYRQGREGELPFGQAALLHTAGSHKASCT
eukprot:1160954-Pelagomonas_calceolata.AAC.2